MHARARAPSASHSLGPASPPATTFSPRGRSLSPASAARRTRADPSCRAAAWPRQPGPGPVPPRLCTPRTPLCLRLRHRLRSFFQPPSRCRGAAGSERQGPVPARREETPRGGPGTLATSGSCPARLGSGVASAFCDARARGGQGRDCQRSGVFRLWLRSAVGQPHKSKKHPGYAITYFVCTLNSKNNTGLCGLHGSVRARE